jgi:hypothetical protein
MNIDDYIESDPKLAPAMQWATNDGTLAGGERALAVIVDALVQQAHRLDAAELTALANAMTAYAKEVHTQEEAGRKIIERRMLRQQEDR